MADLIKFAKIAAVVKFTIMPAGKKNRKFSNNCKIAYVSFKNFKDIPVENPLVGSGGQLVVKKIKSNYPARFRKRKLFVLNAEYVRQNRQQGGGGGGCFCPDFDI